MNEDTVITEVETVQQENKINMLFIVNPVSGKKTAVKYMTEVIELFSNNGYFVTTMLTNKVGDATTFTVEYGKDYDIIVCMGGDGTLNEVVTGIGRTGLKTVLGYIPCGSTNDFAMSHDLASEIMEAANNIIHKDIHKYDYGIINGDNYFTYVAALGAFTALSYGTSQSLKNKLGHAAYMLGVVGELINLRSYKLKATDDTGKEYSGKFLYCSATSSTSIAGVFELPKDMVNTSDGLFEIILVRTPPNLKELITIIRAMFSQKYEMSPYVEIFKSSKITFETEDETVDIAIDGEKTTVQNKFVIENIKQGFSLKG